MKIKKQIIKRIKKLKGWLLIIGLILISHILLKTSVYAGSKDSKLVRNQIDGIYAIAPLSDKIHLYNFEIYTVNDKITYCIEIGKKITTDIYNSTTNTSEQEAMTNLTNERLNYIKAIAYFGYGYLGHNDNKYYMAAQELIWEYLNNIDISWTNELDINGPKINIDAFKNEIINLVERYLTPLTIPKSAVYYIGTNHFMTDPNNSISFYTTTSPKIQQLNINKNNLEIKIGTDYIGNTSILLTRKKEYTQPSVIYNSDDSQIMLSAGNLDDLTHEISIKIKGATLTSYVIDKDTNKYLASGQASLLDPTYELYDENKKLIHQYQIPYPGFQIITNLPYGIYYIKHKTPSKGYILNNEIIKININQLNNNVTLMEEVIKNSIEINKLYEFENENKREANITFEIYDNNNQLYTTVTTTEKGPDVVRLPYGKYTIKQNNTTYGYEKVDDIEINIDKENNTIVKYNLLDKKIKTLVHITTKDKNTEENILESNIKYKIINKETDKYITYKNKNDEEISEYLTNENGELTLPIKLPYGIYILEQVTPPKQYLKNDKTITFSINDKTEYNYIDNEIMLNIDYYNEPIIGRLKIITTEEIINIKNNEFQKENVIRPNKEVEVYLNEELLDIFQTDKSGNLVINNLPLGNYCIIDKETQEKRCIKLQNTDNQTKIIEKKVELVKQKEFATLIITNIDIYNNPISESTIELYQDNKNIIKAITNEKGTITIKNIPIGNYCLKETKINNKYEINKDSECFEIDNKTKIKNITIINKIKTTKIKVPNTLNNIKQKKIALPILLIAVSIIIIIKKKSMN